MTGAVVGEGIVARSRVTPSSATTAAGSATETTSTTDVAIAGAGPVGLMLALSLARRGIRSVVLESKTRLDPHSRATLLVPRSLEILAELGVLDRIENEGQRYAGIEIARAGNGAELVSVDFSRFAAETATPYLVAIPQDRTERILLDAVCETGLVDVRFGSPLVGFEDRGDRVDVRIGEGSSRRSISAAVLVGADGARSAVRKGLGWQLEGTTYPTRAFLADVEVSPEADRERRWVADPRAESFTFAIGFGRRTWRIIESVVPEGLTEDDFDDHARHLAERMLGPGSWRATTWTAAYRKHQRRAPRYRWGRVVLAGDAAHLNSPAGGQGLNTGFGDAHALAWRLDRIVRGGTDITAGGRAARSGGDHPGDGSDAPVTAPMSDAGAAPGRVTVPGMVIAADTVVAPGATVVTGAAVAAGMVIASDAASARDPLDILDTYSTERTAAFDADTSELSAGIERMETLPRWVRNAGFAVLGVLHPAPLFAAVGRRMSMLDPTRLPVPPGSPDVVGRRMPNLELPDGSRLYEHAGYQGLVVRAAETPTAVVGLDPGGAMPVVEMSFMMHESLRKYAAVRMRPDHIITGAVAK